MDIPNIEKRFEKIGKSRAFNLMLDKYDLRNKKVLDLGCGYGEFLTKFGPGSVGITTTDEEVAYGKLAGLHIIKGNVEDLHTFELLKDFDVIWANNLFEHLLSPHAFLVQLKAIVKKDALIILGVPMVPRIVSLLRLNKFRGALASNHINFFTKKTLALTAEYAGWKVKENRPFIFSNVLLDADVSSFAPHLYLIAQNDPSFKYPEKKLKEWSGEKRYEHLLDIVEKNTNK